MIKFVVVAGPHDRYAFKDDPVKDASDDMTCFKWRQGPRFAVVRGRLKDHTSMYGTPVKARAISPECGAEIANIEAEITATKNRLRELNEQHKAAIESAAVRGLYVSVKDMLGT